MPNNFLLISYLFPPAGGVAVQRILSLARYLPQNDCTVHVLSCRNPGVATIDPTLVKRVPPEVTIHRTLSPELPFHFRKKIWSLFSPFSKKKKAPAQLPFASREKPVKSDTETKLNLKEVIRRILCPDPEVLWNLSALGKARRIIREHNIDTIITTAPPFSSLLLANRLKREFPNLIHAADFRDAWLGYYVDAFDFYRSAYMRKKAVQFERETAENADIVVCVTPSITREMRDRYHAEAGEKFVYIPNGYDPELFANFKSRKHEGRKIVITYTGTMHGTSSPRFFLDGMDSLPEQLRERFELRIFGRITDEQAPYLENRKLEIKRFGFVPQPEALKYVEETDYLLLSQLHGPSLPGKIFEYLATGKPILAIAWDDGEVAALLRETGAGWSADPERPEEIHNMLRRAAQAHDDGMEWPRVKEAIERFDRSRLAAEYAESIRKCMRPALKVS